MIPHDPEHWHTNIPGREFLSEGSLQNARRFVILQLLETIPLVRCTDVCQPPCPTPSASEPFDRFHSVMVSSIYLSVLIAGQLMYLQ